MVRYSRTFNHTIPRSFRYASPRLWNQLPDSLSLRHVSLVSSVSIHRLIHLSTHPCHHRHCQHPSLLHSFTQGSKPTFSTNPSHLNFYSLLTGLPSWSSDCTGLITLIGLFFFSFTFLFVPCDRLNWLSVSFLLHVKYTVSYRIIACTI